MQNLYSFLAILIVTTHLYSQEIHQAVTDLQGEYLGQKPPGQIPEVFAPGIVSTQHRDHSDLLFSKNGKELYWSVAHSNTSCAIFFMKLENNQWTAPQVAPFSSAEFFDCIPFFSYDEKKLYFSSRRPVEGNSTPGKLNIWYVERIGNAWSEPMILEPNINHSGHDSNPLVSKNGTLYFASDRAGSKGSWDIYRSPLVAGEFTSPENLGEQINSEYIEICSYIDPEERFIIFSSYGRPEGFGSGDIYISFRKKDGSWVKAKNIGDKINSSGEDAFGNISPDGKYFFFGSDRNGNFDVYWMNAELIHEKIIAIRLESIDKNMPDLKGAYLGEKPPGMLPQRFSPEIVSTAFMEHSPVTFSPDGKELYWSPDFRDFGISGASIFVMRQDDNRWSAPRLATFSKSFFDYNPVLSTNGNLLFFTSSRAYQHLAPESRDLDIWMTHRTSEGWAEPQKIEIENRPGYLMTQFSLTQKNTLYFSSTRDFDAHAWDIFRAEYENGEFLNTERLGISINTAGWETYPFIAPDENYLIFTSMSRSDGFGSMDLYISFRNKDGVWSKPKNMGEKINTKYVEAFASVSPDGKYLFFASSREGNVDMYWVDARIIDELSE